MNTVMQEYFDRMFGEIHSRFDRVEERLDSLEARFGWLYNAIGELFETFAGNLTERMDRVETRVAGVEDGLGQFRTKFDAMDFRFTQDFLMVEGQLRLIDQKVGQQNFSIADMGKQVERVVTCFELVDKRNGILADRMGFVELGLNKMTGHVGDLTVEIRQYLRQASAALN